MTCFVCRNLFSFALENELCTEDIVLATTMLKTSLCPVNYANHYSVIIGVFHHRFPHTSEIQYFINSNVIFFVRKLNGIQKNISSCSCGFETFCPLIYCLRMCIIISQRRRKQSNNNKKNF